MKKYLYLIALLLPCVLPTTYARIEASSNLPKAQPMMGVPSPVPLVQPPSYLTGSSNTTQPHITPPKAPATTPSNITRTPMSYDLNYPWVPQNLLLQ